jgi:hypothetical protein
MFGVAHALGKTIREIEELSYTEIAEHLAFLKIENER